MGHHLTDDGHFKSDKYDWCPEGFFALKFTDRTALPCISLYATLTADRELAEDLLVALLAEEDTDEPAYRDWQAEVVQGETQTDEPS